MKSLKTLLLSAQKGFTLVEAMISMGVFMIMALGLGGSFIYSLKISEYNMSEFTARTAAQSYLEQLRVVDYASLLRSIKTPTQELPTMRVSMTQSGVRESLESSPLLLNTWVNKDLPMVTTATGTGNNRKADNTLEAKFYVEARNLNTGLTPYQAIEIRIKVQWLPPQTKDWSKAKTATYATVRSSVP